VVCGHRGRGKRPVAFLSRSSGHSHGSRREQRRAPETSFRAPWNWRLRRDQQHRTDNRLPVEPSHSGARLPAARRRIHLPRDRRREPVEPPARARQLDRAPLSLVGPGSDRQNNEPDQRAPEAVRLVTSEPRMHVDIIAGNLPSKGIAARPLRGMITLFRTAREALSAFVPRSSWVSVRPSAAAPVWAICAKPSVIPTRREIRRSGRLGTARPCLPQI